MTRAAWVIGASGLLGGAVTRRLRAGDEWDEVIAEPLPWDDPEAAVREVTRLAERVLSTAHPTTLFWCAGASVIGATPDRLAQELDLLTALLDAIADVFTRAPGHELDMFFASSAGGVYAGSQDPPFTEHTEPVPISPYGAAKLESELLTRRFADATGSRLVIGRIANLYGPGQRLDKAQGVISQICRSYITGTPTPIYVSLDTIRDYLFVDDAADLIAATMLIAHDDHVTVKIFGSLQPVTLGAILGLMKAVFKRRPPVMLGRSPNATAQALDLRFRSVVLPQIDQRPRRSLASGIHATALGMVSPAPPRPQESPSSLSR
jgi:UDP-glucose 4-epimerase